MKKKVIKKICREIISISLVPFLLICITLLFENQDKYITYEIPSADSKGYVTKTSGAKPVSAAHKKQEYRVLSLLPEGQYSIKCEGEEICVYNDSGEKVYVAQAYLSEFPENDRLVLKEGLHALSKKELLEIAEYLES